MSTCVRTLVAFVVASWVSVARAEDAYWCLRAADLTIREGNLPQGPYQFDWQARHRMQSMFPYAVLDGEGEIYVTSVEGDFFNQWFPVNEFLLANGIQVTIRAPAGKDVTGQLFVPKTDWSGMDRVKFLVSAGASRGEDRTAFYNAKRWHFQRLLRQDIPGAAWFRHQEYLADKMLGATSSRPAEERPRPDDRPELARTYEMFTGGQAISENLQLDRGIGPAREEQETENIASIPGISIQEIDWKELIKDAEPELDPLASFIPHDQHAVFLPSFAAAVAIADQTDRQGTPVMQLAEIRSQDRRVFARYQQQICLSTSGLSRLLGPSVIRSIALTGSDVNFFTGTDLTVLFEAVDADVLERLILARVTMAARTDPDAKPIQGEVDGVAYRGFRSPGRTTSAYVARLDQVVIVTNSPPQLSQLIRVRSGKCPSIASLSEYTFFRNRYRRGDPDETGLVFLSDATIRRWCGPGWRIADSRRTRGAAVMAELQAANLDRFARGDAQSGPIYTPDLVTSTVGELSLGPQGVQSSILNNLEFMTPVAELPLTKVTRSEAEAYRQWRDNYQRNWRWAFDPIALRLTTRQDRLAADLTVIPLIWNTEYREFVGIAGDARIAPDAGDPHNALAHAVLAIDLKSPLVTTFTGYASAMAKGLTLSWLGSSVAVYFDDDPFWQQLADVPHDKRETFFDEQGFRMPVALRAEVTSGLRLTAFLAAVRAFIEQTAPGMTHWESLSHNDQPYVKISPTERAKGQYKETANAALFYAASGDALVVTPNEDVLKRALDRQSARLAAADQPPDSTTRQWLGGSLSVQAQRRILEVLAAMSEQEYQGAMQSRAWGNLSILNEWKRRYPDQDPVALHERFWQTRLVCPGGGKYVWNAAWQTMESTVYGHPGIPRRGPSSPPTLAEFDFADFGLTFEHNGLRAQVILQPAAAVSAKK